MDFLDYQRWLKDKIAAYDDCAKTCYNRDGNKIARCHATVAADYYSALEILQEYVNYAHEERS